MTDNKKPVILISCGNPDSPEIRTKLLVQYIHSQGGIPILADHSKPEHIAALVEAADGIIVQGNAFAPESLRFTGQSRGFSSKLGNGDKIVFENSDNNTIQIRYAEDNAVPYPGRLLPVQASALGIPEETGTEKWYLVDPNLADLRGVEGINRILRVNPETKTFYEANGTKFDLPAGWEFKVENSTPEKAQSVISRPDGSSLKLEGMLVDPVSREAFPRNQAENVTPLTEEPTEFYHRLLSFKPDEHRRGNYEHELFRQSEVQSTETTAVARDSSNLPVLAICGGFQELAGLHGARFFPYIDEDVEQHLPEADRVIHYNPDMRTYKQIEMEARKKFEEGMHIFNLPAFEPSAEVEVLPGALGDIIGAGRFRPMTTHVTGVDLKSLPPELELTAKSPDGVAEGFRYIDPRNPERFFHAVQSHPDGFQTEQDFKLVDAFMAQARSRATEKSSAVPAIPREYFENPVVAADTKQIDDLLPEQRIRKVTPWRELISGAIQKLGQEGIELAARAIPDGLLR